MQTGRFYRAVSLAECDELTSTGRFRAAAGSLEGKWFAENPHDARKWGDLLFGSVPFRIIVVSIPQPIADILFRLEKLDNIGPARFAELSDLSAAVIEQVVNE
jgi:hypothetical protein